MKPAQIRKIIFNIFNTRVFWFWVFVRLISTFGPILITYIFARGVKALETHQPIDRIIQIFFILLLVRLFANMLRIASKTRIALYTEGYIVGIQERLAETIDPPKPKRKEIIQALRNLTQGVRKFVEYFYNNGLQAIVSFVSIPIILFFIDKKIFLIEIIAIVIYLLITYVFSIKYEKEYEHFDKSREKYFSKLLDTNRVESKANILVTIFRRVQDLLLVEWLTLQNFIALFELLILSIIAIDFVNGTKQIHHLILIMGYVKETHVFLNALTSTVERYMQIEAGIEMVSIDCRYLRRKREKVRSIA